MCEVTRQRSMFAAGVASGGFLSVGLAAAFGLAASPAMAEAPIDSVYSTLNWEEGCVVEDSAPADGPGEWARLVCDGHGGYPVHVSEDDLRMSLDYGFVDSRGPWESFSGFNRVHDAIEWRRQAGEGARVPFATIHRWFVSTGETEREVLVVSTVAPRGGGGQSCAVGYVDAALNSGANTLARRVADELARDFACGTHTPRYHGERDAGTPRPVRASVEPSTPPADQADGPEKMLERYWEALRTGNSLRETQNLRAEGLTAHSRVAKAEDAGLGEILLGFYRLMAHIYRIDSATVIASGGEERRVRVTLTPRQDEGRERAAEFGLVRQDKAWRIATEDWDLE